MRAARFLVTATITPPTALPITRPLYRQPTSTRRPRVLGGNRLGFPLVRHSPQNDAPAPSQAGTATIPSPGHRSRLPVGAVFIAVVGTDPATLLGYGTWVAFGAGRVLVGRDAGDVDFDTAEETGGAKTKAISAHAGTAVADHADHTHQVTSNVTETTTAVQSGAGTTVGTGTLINNTVASGEASVTL